MRASLIMVVAVVGCASSAPVAPPQTTVDRYLKAIDAGDATTAREMLSSPRREQVDDAAFLRRFGETQAEQKETAQRIRDTGTQAEAEATVELSNGETVKLVLEDGQWRIAAGLLDAGSLRTPVDAVQTLRRVLLRRDLAGLLALLTRQERTSWEAALGRVIEGTADPLDWETEIRGDDATVRTTGGGVIVLRRESGRWRVQDIRDGVP